MLVALAQNRRLKEDSVIGVLVGAFALGVRSSRGRPGTRGACRTSCWSITGDRRQDIARGDGGAALVLLMLFPAPTSWR